MRFGSTAKVLAECKLKYYRVSECHAVPDFRGSDGLKASWLPVDGATLDVALVASSYDEQLCVVNPSVEMRHTARLPSA